MPFDFATAGRIVFRNGAAADVPALACALGKRVLVCASRESAPIVALRADLAAAGASNELVLHRGEPTVDSIAPGLELARQFAPEVVVAWGGGSVLDVGKALAGLHVQPGGLFDYLEVVGAGRSLAVVPPPLIAVPTTAGTGSEVSKNAVLRSPAHGVKASIRSPWLIPRVAVIDPELTLTLPPAVTAATGLDALTQVIEPFVSRRHNEFVDLFCRAGIVRAAQALPRAFARGDDLAARTDLCFASVCGGLALANAGLGAVHGFAAAIGGLVADAPHGALCAALLPAVVAANIAALVARESDPAPLRRFTELAALLTGRADAAPADAVAVLEALRATLAVARLGELGVAPAMHADIVARAQAASSMAANPIALQAAELAAILAAAS